MVSFRNLLLSDSQRQVEAEARNISLAHTIRDLITDSYQKKQAVKALQKAPPAQVNELISILKAMPDPTVVEFKTVHSRENSRHHYTSDSTQALNQVDGSSSIGGASSENSKDDKAKDGTEEVEAEVEVEMVKAPSSWWAVSFASLMASFMSSSPTGEPSVTTTTTTVTTITLSDGETVDAESVPSGASPAVSIHSVKESITEIATVTTAEAEAANGVKNGTATKTTTTSTTVATACSADKTVLVSTLNSIKQQIAAFTRAPPTNVISAYTFWWGYEIYVPHKCMSKLQRVTNTSQIFFGFLSGAVTGIPGLAALVPLSRIISAWVGFQWAVIHAEDLGKGVVLSATWVLPVALAPRPWDHPGTEDDPAPVASPKQKQRRIKTA
ncbi:hypothetical protein BGZ58_000012 [Dissophora ornata]|nr:hypothetical protein BGZ58_000012 [Dissophora ornata]